MKTRNVAILAAIALGGCSTSATLFPVEGPLTTQVPVPTLKAKVDGILGNTGNVSLKTTEGESCSGKWSSVAPMEVVYSSSSASASANNGMQAAWATVYGSGFTVANKPGINRGEAVLVCERGTMIQVEFFTGSGTANGNGVAKDNRGNTYKVLF